MFYPKLSRREKYGTKENGDWYASYQKYREEIIVDCQNRCVYCDIQTSEYGDDVLQLDHFRPQSLFPELSNNPTNLVAACPVCNRHKSNIWPVEKDSKLTYSGLIGFVDPFEDDFDNYCSINEDGTIKTKKPPADYIVKTLRLNRAARVYTRRVRILRNKVRILSERIENLLAELQQDIGNTSIPRATLETKIQKITLAFQKLNELQTLE